MNSPHKDDSDKLRYDLVPQDALAVVVKILMHGSVKYADFNWKKISEPRKRYANAAQRHLVAILSGEDLDEDSGLPHAAHLACNGLFLTWFALRAASKNRSRRAPRTARSKPGKLDPYIAGLLAEDVSNQFDTSTQSVME